MNSPYCYVLPGKEPVLDAGKMRNNDVDRIVMCMKDPVPQTVVRSNRTIIDHTHNEHGNGNDNVEAEVVPQGSFANADTRDESHGAWAIEGKEFSAIVNGKPVTYDPRDESVAE